MIKQYTEQDLLRVAKRFHNKKRKYLLVNPLQGKHMPVSPREALTMMTTLGEKVRKSHPDARLVIGFAETATAIGCVMAKTLAPDCMYVHTTREKVGGVADWIEFKEEHSHAVEQRLAADDLAAWLDRSPTVVLVDDEISTGRTILNLVADLREAYPQIRQKQIIATSILNRVAPENERQLAQEGVSCEYLLKLSEGGFTEQVAPLAVAEAAPARPAKVRLDRLGQLEADYPDPRLGTPIGVYTACCAGIADAFTEQFLQRLPEGGTVLVLGTEECMYPALALGARLEKSGRFRRVVSQSTTRSPIGVLDQPDYPIRSGTKCHSFYDAERVTYIYDLAAYDAVVIVSDAVHPVTVGVEDLIGALPRHGAVYLLQGDGRIWECAADE
jgi:adenine/guanine phosphoribosyltransferase-like PRPP-binding protein